MPTMGVGRPATEEAGVSTPVGATLKVAMTPLLEAMRKFPSGVAARDMPAQLSSVSPLAKGEPATAARAPVVGLIVITLIDWSPELATKRRFLAALTVIRSTA